MYRHRRLYLRLASSTVTFAAVSAPILACAAPPAAQSMLAVSALQSTLTPPGGPVRVSSGVMASSVLTRTDPVYPADAKAQHVQGAVVLHAIISKTGTIENLEVISGPEMLRQASIDAVKQWTYKPYLLNGEPVEVDTTITVNFTFGG